MRTGCLLVLLMLTACRRDQSNPVPVGSSPALGGSGVVGVMKPGASHPGWVKPTKASTFQKPTRARNASEQTLYGTWVATVGDYGSRSAFAADRVMLKVDQVPGKDGLSAIVDAIANDKKLSSGCIWLELEQDGTGIRRECAIVNGEPSALDQNDPLSGAKKDLGTKLEWYVEEKPPTFRFHFADDMVVPAVRDGALVNLAFRDWVVAVGPSVGPNKFEMTESFPEHDYVLPTHYTYEIFPQKFLGR